MKMSLIFFWDLKQ